MDNEAKMIEVQSGIVSVLDHMVAGSPDNLTKRFIKNEQVQDFIDNKSQSARFPITQNEIKTAILSTGTINDPLVGPQKYEIAPGATRRLFVRDLLRQGTTDQGMVEYPIESTFTNNAGVQVGGSPESYQNVNLGESGFTFTLTQEIVRTLGHYQHVSKQALQDSGVLDAFLRNRLLYGLRVYEEDQLLNGTDANGQLNGLLTQATAYTTQSPELTNELDIIADVIRQIQEADFYPSAVVMHPADWYSIVVRKEGTSADGYVLGAPLEQTTPRIFGIPVVITNSIASGTCLVGDFQRGASLFDREEAAVEISYHNAESFRKNMVTMRALERIALVVTNPLALVTASI